MNIKLPFYWIALVVSFALQPAAYASLHLMQIEQIIGGVNGDTTAQAIQLRMRAAGQNFVSGGKLVVVDAAGLNPVTVLDLSSNVAHGALGDRVLIASAAFASHTMPAAVPDFTMAKLIPASYFAAGSLVWESDTGTVYWRLSWGGAGYTGPNTGSAFNDADGNFGPAFGGAIAADCGSALQFQGNATDLSSNNAADYRFTAGAITFVNNAGASFAVDALLPAVSVTASDPSASENPTSDTGKFRIKRSDCTDSDLTVFYTISGTASNGVDYQKLKGRAKLRAGRASATVAVRPIDDSLTEPDETVILTLSPNPDYTIGARNSATVTIHSNE